MREEVGYSVKDVSDKEHKELSPAWVYQIFEDKYINDNSVFSVPETHYVLPTSTGSIGKYGTVHVSSLLSALQAIPFEIASCRCRKNI